jgi:NADH:ubiquinone oxidoreductase subunit
MSVEIEFGEVPSIRRSGRLGRPLSTKHLHIAKQLRERPNEWSLILRNLAASTSTQVRTGQLAAYRPSGSFEAKVRRNPEHSRYDVWARYVGEQP